MARNGESEAGPAVDARGGGVGLLKLLKQPDLGFPGDPDARVADRDLHGFPQALPDPPNFHCHLARVGELDGVADQIGQHLPDPDRVAREAFPDFRVVVQPQRQTSRRRVCPEHGRHFFDQPPEIERRCLHAQLACLNLRQIQNVVDQLHQSIGGNADRFQFLAPRAILLAFERQLGHSGDGVERGPNFVAHVGQKLALSRVGLLGEAHGLLRRLALAGGLPVEPREYEQAQSERR